MRVSYNYTNYPHSKAATAWSRFRGMVASMIIVWVGLLGFCFYAILSAITPSDVAGVLAVVLAILGIILFFRISTWREILCAAYDLKKIQLGRELTQEEKMEIRSRLKAEKAEKAEKANKAGNSVRWIGIISLVFLIAGIIIGRFTPPATRQEEIPRESFPRYGSAEQKDDDDYVQLNIESIKYIGKASSTTRTRMRSGTMSNSTYYQIYLVKDDGGRLLTYADKDSYDLSLFREDGDLEKSSLPFTVYGRLSTVEKYFSDYTGYDQSFKPFADYDLVIEFDGPTAYKSVVLEENKDLRNLITNAQYGLLIAAVASFIFYRYKRKKAEEAANTSEGS